MNPTLIAFGVLAFAVLCCLVAVLGLRSEASEARRVADLRKRWREKSEEQLWEKLWALSRGMEAMGMQYQPGTKSEPTYKFVKREP